MMQERIGSDGEREFFIEKKLYRNDKCHCGSKLKYKKCCYKKTGKNPRVEYTFRPKDLTTSGK